LGLTLCSASKCSANHVLCDAHRFDKFGLQRSKAKQNKTKHKTQNKTKQNKTKQNKTKQNKYKNSDNVSISSCDTAGLLLYPEACEIDGGLPDFDSCALRRNIALGYACD
jgi:hypothetical protein